VHEVSLRAALGASRGRLAQQLLVESLMLAGFGALLGLAFAAWGGRALVAQLSTPVTRVVLDLSIDWRVVAFTTTIALATAAIFGTAPAFRATRVEPIDALKDQARGATGSPRATLSTGLVITQIALSLVLVITAGLFVRTFRQLASAPLGFDSDRVLVVNVETQRARVNPADRLAFYQRLIDAVAAVPGVARAAASSVTPVSGASTRFPVNVQDAPPMSDRERSVRANAITPGWFAAYGTAIRAGRDIDSHDTASAPPVMLVNEAFVRRFLPGRNPIGASVTPLPPPGSAKAPTPSTIVGVVSDAVYRSVRAGTEPTVYLPVAQEGVRATNVSISLRAEAGSGSPARLAPSVAAALTAVDRDLAFSFRPLADQVRA
jgi:predicted permease